MAAVLGGRTFYFLPYYNAEIGLKEKQRTIHYSLVRTDEPAAEFRVVWTIGEALPLSNPSSIEFFLTERYCLYSERVGKLYRSRIHHEPWPLQQATVSSFNSTMIEALGLAAPKGNPLLHYAEEIKVDIWPLKKL